MGNISRSCCLLGIELGPLESYLHKLSFIANLFIGFGFGLRFSCCTFSFTSNYIRFCLLLLVICLLVLEYTNSHQNRCCCSVLWWLTVPTDISAILLLLRFYEYSPVCRLCLQPFPCWIAIFIEGTKRARCSARYSSCVFSYLEAKAGGLFELTTSIPALAT